jgi:hypothetical protein
MNSLFGDATTIAPTPETLAEAESLFSGTRSPVPSFRLGDNGENVPEMEIAPPDVDIEDGKPMISKEGESEREGLGGWISNLVKRNKRDDANGSTSGRYKKVDQDDVDEDGDVDMDEDSDRERR